eukprot:7280699-Ditylum_brightwellii.AAC.1
MDLLQRQNYGKRQGGICIATSCSYVNPTLALETSQVAHNQGINKSGIGVKLMEQAICDLIYAEEDPNVALVDTKEEATVSILVPEGFDLYRKIMDPLKNLRSNKLMSRQYFIPIKSMKLLLKMYNYYCSDKGGGVVLLVSKHIGYHYYYDPVFISEEKIPQGILCGMCGISPAMTGLTTHSNLGLPDWVKEKTPKYDCWYVPYINFSLDVAATSSECSPCTNQPMVCLCYPQAKK